MRKILVFSVVALVLLLLPIIAYLFEWISRSALFTALIIYVLAVFLGFFVKWDRRSMKIEDDEQQEVPDKSGLR
jgi:Tfp pilus assembly protein PilO